ncbi:DoxX family membrane protein [Mucilaginibacter sp. UR6-11]|uniref:DoxX family protein n=1 Tax=Mucilaginibacter sp. UR6-11 TaxID=1435644 RepID=UPI001E4E26C0|nr:DoxX family membrane protein [Mucilaginibacter sp. UR6-11]MCC8424225.1 DoxX family membrane protein [Mucilaginibacter sp. UR6-11]
MIKKTSLVILITGYLYAGINHFRNPESYRAIIPHYIPFPALINSLAGLFEILFGLLLIFKTTRPFAALGIGLMLTAFLPVHIQMIIDAPFKLGAFIVTPLVAWARLALQPLLILWACWYIKPDKNVIMLS